MKKIFLVIAFLFMFVGLGFTAEASTVNETNKTTVVNVVVDLANTMIESLVVKAQQDADALLTMGLTEEEYNAQLDQIIVKLVNDTNNIAKATITFGSLFGATLECEYVDYQIGNRIVSIDPIIVGGWDKDQNP